MWLIKDISNRNKSVQSFCSNKQVNKRCNHGEKRKKNLNKMEITGSIFVDCLDIQPPKKYKAE